MYVSEKSTLSEVFLRTWSKTDSQSRASGQRDMTPKTTGTLMSSATRLDSHGLCTIKGTEKAVPRVGSAHAVSRKALMNMDQAEEHDHTSHHRRYKLPCVIPSIAYVISTQAPTTLLSLSRVDAASQQRFHSWTLDLHAHLGGRSEIWYVA